MNLAYSGSFWSKRARDSTNGKVSSFFPGTPIYDPLFFFFLNEAVLEQTSDWWKTFFPGFL
jgi:hypothetical protein